MDTIKLNARIAAALFMIFAGAVFSPAYSSDMEKGPGPRLDDPAAAKMKMRGHTPIAGANSRHDWKRIAEKLELSEDQIEKLRDERECRRAEHEEVRLRERSINEELKRLLSSEKPDEGKIEKLIESSCEVHRKMMQSRVDSLMNFRKILSEEQWGKLNKLKNPGRRMEK